jgi:hypothetical protein
MTFLALREVGRDKPASGRRALVGLGALGDERNFLAKI